MRASAGTRSRSTTSPPRIASTAIAISATSNGTGTSLLALARSNRPSEPGSTSSPSRRTLGGRVVAVAGDRLQLGVVLRECLLLGGTDSAVVSAVAARGGAAARAVPLVGSARDGGPDQLTAVGVLVDVARNVVERPPELLVCVGLVELAVVVAVGDRVRLCRRGQRESAEHGQQENVSYDSGHSADSLLGGERNWEGKAVGEGRTRTPQTASRRLAGAPATRLHPPTAVMCPRGRCIAKRLLPGL